jgi:sulfur carrier protein ThiS
LSGILGYAKEKIGSPFPTNSFLAAVVNQNMFDDEQMVVSLNMSGVSSGYYEKMITGVK